jgi:hypothetical protein
MEEGGQIIIKEAGKNIVQEFSVVPVTLDEGQQVPTIGEVAAPLAGQAQLDSQPAHFFQEEDSGTQFCSPPRGHQTRGAPTYHNYVPSHFL